VSKTASLTIAPAIKVLFAIAALLLVIIIFVQSWSTTGPTLLPIEDNIAAQRAYLPHFLQLPAHSWEIAMPTIAIIIGCSLLRFFPPNNWTRPIVKLVLIGLLGRYFVWRTIATLNFASVPSTILSLLLYVIEIIGIFVLLVSSFQSMWSTENTRRIEADRYEPAIRSGAYVPSVDIFVPTYNEPEFIVQRTVIGCQAIEYPNKTIYILDDTRRPHIRDLADRLGCKYITRDNNAHAKAGNLNNALPQTHGELILIMDADFVPFKQFLMRTVGFFQSPDVGLVQTPQDFYNPDHHARNLGIDHILPNDLTNFFSFNQGTRDIFNGVVCCGTSYVVRRRALESIGGYYTRCTAEDFPTSSLMLTRGWRILYLSETLSMGESTRNYSDFLKQRLRWMQGNLQIYGCTDEVPIWTNLTWGQQSFYLVQYIGGLNPVFRFIYMITPLLSLYLGVSPYNAPLAESIYYFVPYMLFMFASFSWSVHYTMSIFWSEIYDVMVCFPGMRQLYGMLFKSIGKGFVVTAKGVTSKSKRYNLNNTYPLLIFLILTVIVVTLHFGGSSQGWWQTVQNDGFSMVFFWVVYNFIMVSTTLLCAIDQPERRLVDRFPLRTRCQITVDGVAYVGYTENLSEGGARIVMPKSCLPDTTIALTLPDYQFTIDVQVCRRESDRHQNRFYLEFAPPSLAQTRQLVDMLYTEVTWWKERKRPSSLDSLLALCSALVQLKPLRNQF
jgi:cellulose synthase (UDP-forming)